jgi:hypothetical protein
MNSTWDEIQVKLNQVRGEVVQHELYTRVDTLNGLHVLMKHHVFAVWDFMSLLKALQVKLTCTQVPWFPVANANTAFLINEIVVGEETDVDQHEQRMSHFELYLKAMQECGADCSIWARFQESYHATKNLETAFEAAALPETIRNFVRFTFEVIHTDKPHVIVAVFTFGREDLIPDMFIELVKELSSVAEQELATFVYYLERHIEVDGGHHGQLARQMLEDLCGDSKEKWDDVLHYALRALEMRKQLWDGALAELA